MLVRLLYASRPAEQSANSFVDDILKSCRENNPQHGITGVLCFSEQAFLQLIEGDRVAINRVYGQIVQDQRHTDVSLLHYEEINERIFGSWTMGQANLERINPSVILKYCPLPVIDPFAISGSAALALLKDLFASASIVGRA